MNVFYSISNTHNGLFIIAHRFVYAYARSKPGFIYCISRSYEKLYAFDTPSPLNSTLLRMTYEQCRYINLQYIFTSLSPIKKIKQHKKYQNNIYTINNIYIYSCLLFSQYNLSNRILSWIKYRYVSPYDIYSEMMNQCVYIHIYYYYMTCWPLYLNHTFLTRTQHNCYHSIMRVAWIII